MPVWLDVILEIIKSVVPALIVFLTVYVLLKQFFAGQQQRFVHELKQGSQKTGLPLKMQAYERLSLFCERISLPNMLLRIQRNGMTVSELRVALLMGIQQEFEHNVTQQVYVSDQLWKIIKFARDFNMEIIARAADSLDSRGNAQSLADAIIQVLDEQQGDPLHQAQLAIKKEAAVYIG